MTSSMVGLRTWVKMTRSMSRDVEAAVVGQLADEARPALVVDLGRVALDHAHLGAPRAHRLLASAGSAVPPA